MAAPPIIDAPVSWVMNGSVKISLAVATSVPCLFREATGNQMRITQRREVLFVGLAVPGKNGDAGIVDQRHDSVRDCVMCFFDLAGIVILWPRRKYLHNDSMNFHLNEFSQKGVQ
jgi:hypothetical protein